MVSPAEALAQIGFYLRWHRQPVIIGGAVAGWHPTAMRNSAAYTAMPAFEPVEPGATDVARPLGR